MSEWENLVSLKILKRHKAVSKRLYFIVIVLVGVLACSHMANHFLEIIYFHNICNFLQFKTKDEGWELFKIDKLSVVLFCTCFLGGCGNVFIKVILIIAVIGLDMWVSHSSNIM